MKRTYNTPAIEEIRLDNEISLQLASPTINQDYELKAPAAQGAPRGMDSAPEDPYQYESW